MMDARDRQYKEVYVTHSGDDGVVNSDEFLESFFLDDKPVGEQTEAEATRT